MEGNNIGIENLNAELQNQSINSINLKNINSISEVDKSEAEKFRERGNEEFRSMLY